MKLNFGRKLVLFLHWLLSLAACAITLLFCVWPDTIQRGFDAAYAAIGKGNTDIIGIAFLALYVILAVASAIIIFSRDGKRGDRGFITVDSSEAGRTRIAVGAVEQMIRQAVRGVDGISEMKSSIVNCEDAISINTSVTIVNGAHVPTVTMNIQRSIRSYIELNCGVAVREVSVSVNALDGGDGNRHGRKKGSGDFTAAPVQQPTVEPEIQIEPAPQAEPVSQVEPQDADEGEGIRLHLDPIMDAPAEDAEAPIEEE